MKVRLHDIAHARAGDKGNRSNLSLIAYAPELYATLKAQVTEAYVAKIFADWRPTRVARYELPKLCAFNFVLDDLLQGGVNAGLSLDGHGKSLSFTLLDARIDIDPLLAGHIKEGGTLR